MKREYTAPRMEAIEIRMGQQLLAGSEVSGIGGGIFDPTPLPGDGTGGGTGRAPLFDDFDIDDAPIGISF